VIGRLLSLDIMSIESERDWRGLRHVGRIVARALVEMERRVRPGITTGELDAIATRVLHTAGARHAPRHTLGFPADSCISVNDEAVHGIPGGRRIAAGDLVKLDIVVEKDGYMADAAITVAVPPVSDERQRLIACARAAFNRAVREARPGRRVNAIGQAIEHEVRRRGFSVMRELAGHGTGRRIHEPPSVLNYQDRFDRQRLTEGLVLAVEPIIAAGSGRAIQDEDGWTIRTADGSLSAHYEHTIVVTRGRPVVLTSAVA
jgi:methionyl aminopeptidase